MNLQQQQTNATNMFSKEKKLAQPNSNLQSQYYTNTQISKTESLKIEISLLFHLQQHETTNNQLTKFTRIPKTAESLQVIIKLNLLG